MSYLQITSRCNMTCVHCCFNCTSKGRDMQWATVQRAVEFSISTLGEEHVTIGGGEPTLHPQFFDIIELCLTKFYSTMIITNGSQMEVMYRLADILDENDYDKEGENCIIPRSPESLQVELSQDPYHSTINKGVVDLWKASAKRNKSYGVRDVSKNRKGLMNRGRAKINQLGSDDSCACADILIKPSGKIKACGCDSAPIIGDVKNDISKYWSTVLQSDEWNDSDRCYNDYKKRMSTK